MANCKKCGKEINDTVLFCKYCGESQKILSSSSFIYKKEKISSSTKKMSSPFIAVLLCLLLGVLGIHNFYLGNIKAGIFKLIILITTGWFGVGFIINAIICIFDCFSIIERDDKEFYYGIYE